MIRATIILAALALVPHLAAATGVPATSPYERGDFQTPVSRIDELVFPRLQRLKIAPANPCSDAVFLRRVYLDVIGTLPTAAEAKAFLVDRNPDKRRILIDSLLERDEFADYWAMKWSELLRVKAEFPINLWPNAVQSYYRWIHESLRQNKPYDQFARELLTASGSNFRDPAANFYRAVQSKEPRAIAQAVALTFMGCRAEKWPKEKLDGMASFFAQIGYKSTGEWKEEIVYFDRERAATRPTSALAVFPDGTAATLSVDRDPREDFVKWLISPGNPWFARSIVNRAWYWLLGRGIVHEPDDFRPDNPPANPELLDYLERELIVSHYDLKHIYRRILNSRTYQLASIPRSSDARTAENFACYPLRRLDAEVLIDAICQITGTLEKYSSAIPEPFTFMPEGQRAVTLPDGSITSSFLEMFGRPARDTGLETERNTRPTTDQRLHLLNSTHIQNKIQSSAKLRALIQRKAGTDEIVTSLYLTILTRYPTGQELDSIRAYVKRGGNPRDAWVDVVWSLLNSAEFLYRH